jgi:hypothetical protein
MARLRNDVRGCQKARASRTKRPMSEHYPAVHGGAAIMLYFLPSGEITYTAR